LSLNPAKKAVLTLRRPFGSETPQSVGLQPLLEPPTDTPLCENRDVLTKVEAVSSAAVSSQVVAIYLFIY